MPDGPVTIHQSMPDETRTALLLQTDSSAILPHELINDDRRSQFDFLNSRVRKARLKPEQSIFVNALACELDLTIVERENLSILKKHWRRQFDRLTQEQQNALLEDDPGYLDTLDENTEFDSVRKMLIDEMAFILNVSVSEIDHGVVRKTALVDDMLVNKTASFSEERMTQREEKKGLLG